MADQSATPKPRPPRRWLRRVLYGLLFFLLAIVIFHRPIIHHGGRWVAIWFAKKEHMDLDLRIKGNIWNRLELHSVTVKATGTGNAPLASASLDRAVLEYDLWKLFDADWSGLHRIEIGQLDAVITPALEVDPEPPLPFTQKVRALLSRPLPTPHVLVGRADIRIQEEHDDIVIRGVHANIPPGTEGFVAWERIAVPGLPVIEEGTAQVKLTAEQLDISDIAVWPEVRIASVRLSRPENDKPAELSADVVLPEGKLTANILFHPAANEAEARFLLETNGVAGLAPRFGLTMPQQLEFISIEGHWRGMPDEPVNSRGSVTFSLTGRKDLVFPGWTASGTIALDQGRLTLTKTELRAADTVLMADGDFDASKLLSPTGTDQLTLPDGTLRFQLNAPDLAKASAEFGQQLRGQLQSTGTATIADNVVQFDMALSGRGVGREEIEIGEINGRLTGKLPITEEPPLSNLTGDFTGTLKQVETGKGALDQVDLSANLNELQATIRELVITRGANTVRLEGATRLTPTGELAGVPTVKFDIDAPSLEELGLELNEKPVTGGVRGSGSLSLKNGRADGSAKLDATDLHVGDFQAGELSITSNAVEGQLESTLTGRNVGHGEVKIGEANARFVGQLPATDEPPLAALRGDLTGKLTQVETGDATLDQVDFDANLNALEATLRDLVVTRGANRARAEGKARLTAAGGLAEAPTLKFDVDAPSIEEFGVKFGDQPLKGTVRGSGTVTLKDGRPDGTMKLDATDLEIGDTKAGTLSFNGNILDGESEVSFTASHGQNHIRAKGRVRLNEKGEIERQPDMDFEIDAPEIGEFGLKLNGAPITGSVKGSGSVSLAGEYPAGNVQLTASNLRIGEARAGELTLQASAADGTLVITSLRAQFNANDYLEASGRVGLAAPRAYEGKVNLNVRNLAAFQPIMEALGQERQLAGALTVNWEGRGDQAAHTGAGTLNARAGRVDALEITEARLAIDYNPERVDVTEFLVVADDLRAVGKLTWVEKRLTVAGLEVQLGGRPVVTGELSIPFDPFAKTVLPPDLPVSAKLSANNLDLERIFRELKIPPRVEGIINATLTASGPLGAPVVKLDASGKGIRMPRPLGDDVTDEQRAVYQTARADFDLEAGFEQNQFTASGTIRHPDLRPLALKANAPLPLKPILEGTMPDWQKIPFTASMELPSSPLTVVSKFSPHISRADGTVAISVQATGTIDNPRLSGSVTANGRSIRMANTSIPPISNLTVRVDFAGDTVTVQRFDGETGGGRFSIAGRITAANLLEPIVDLTVRTNKVLAVRDDSVLVRVDADVALRGPFNAGTATGRVVLVQSRFNKEIQILPILMPGRPKPVPREVSQPRVISFPKPPLRDWKFDIAIITSNDDPFLIRGNLASGRVLVDLRLLGTGEEPYLIGAATMEQFRAQLPVSRLTTRRGQILFSRENPFEPRIEIESETVIRGYTIIARLEGPASAPRLDLTSEPPLPQQDIMSLLTTGSLSGEFGDNNAALATRAGLMVLRDLYKKVFKRDFPSPGNDDEDNFFDRFEVDLGAVDSRTGRQEATAKFKLTDRVSFIGEVELGAGVSGRIQYVFRFR